MIKLNYSSLVLQVNYKNVNFKDIHIYKAEVSSSQQAHNLDKEMNFKAQINNISKAG